MSESAPDQNFQNYKQAEKAALRIVAEMKAAAANKVDIELALLVAVFELHKETVPAATIAQIIQGHLKQLVPHYVTKTPGGK
jgi:F0F1-type ATP synthase assembly protein I